HRPKLRTPDIVPHRNSGGDSKGNRAIGEEGENMDLKTFVAEALQQICDGIKDAQSKDGGDAINAENSANSGHLFSHATYGTFTRVDFDVAVSAETASGAKGGIKVWGVGDLGGGAEHKTGYANRIAFSVPVRLPD